MDWTDSAEALMDQLEAAKTTYYCQAGDHIVNEVVWLEQITMGCAPCMKKLRDQISPDVKLRLWSVTADGLTRVHEKMPGPDSLTVGEVLKKGTTPVRVKVENPKWTCTYCAAEYPDTTNGFYNTVLGFVCKDCAGATKMGLPNPPDQPDDWRQTSIQFLGVTDKLREPISYTVEGDLIPMNETVRCIDCGKHIKPVAAWDPKKDLARCSACWREQGATPIGGGKLLVKNDVTALRKRDLKGIRDLRAVNSKSDLPRRGQINDFVYCIAQDEIYTWTSTGWIRAALPAPTVARLEDEKKPLRNSGMSWYGNPHVYDS